MRCLVLAVLLLIAPAAQATGPLNCAWPAPCAKVCRYFVAQGGFERPFGATPVPLNTTFTQAVSLPFNLQHGTGFPQFHILEQSGQFALGGTDQTIITISDVTAVNVPMDFTVHLATQRIAGSDIPSLRLNLSKTSALPFANLDTFGPNPVITYPAALEWAGASWRGRTTMSDGDFVGVVGMQTQSATTPDVGMQSIVLVGQEASPDCPFGL